MEDTKSDRKKMNEEDKANPKSKVEMEKTEVAFAQSVENGYTEDEPTKQQRQVAVEGRKPRRMSAMMTTRGKAPRRMTADLRDQEKEGSSRNHGMKIVIDLTGSYEVTEIICLSDIEED